MARDRSPSGPPSNAPKAPAAFRRHLDEQQSLNLTYPKSSAGPGSWTQSKRWVSDETKERAAYQKLMQSLHYLGADKSPSLPQTSSELTSFRVAQAESKGRIFGEKLRRMEEAEAQKQRNPQHLEVFHGLDLADGLSPVFAVLNCFNKYQDPKQQAGWPSVAEFKEDGEKRAARYGRYFPLPRLDFIARESEGEDAACLYTSDGSIK
ncbi:uncharacterized protein F5Z01DRAFT_671098 [Emericellopsis atlantica]|uniref:Uncharacterized protein n=1 Tax=Emericellopsis atlantica TaxID=2614577 RepID=A0A9P7ZSX9_9HYPO|nr:uncharacterized protein F5Z01DRAFT_671098 [Emericellopsis atlantica]KAG9257501.1 hypothetical protein F5Z01DRAFT_671098 [Emericellopsis atlantica]